MEKIFDVTDELSGDQVAFELDGADRLVIHSTVHGRSRIVALVGRDAGQKLAHALLDALEHQSGATHCPREETL